VDPRTLRRDTGSLMPVSIARIERRGTPYVRNDRQASFASAKARSACVTS
jgi:hypothetical protein